MPDREKYIEILSKTAKTVREFNEDTPIKISLECIEDILELLKDQEAQKQSILKNIADNQLANSPDEWQSPEQRMYSKGVFDGLQMAYEMLAYGVVKKDA